MRLNNWFFHVSLIVIIAVGAVPGAMVGCATTHFEETLADGSHTTYTGKSIVPPFGKGPDSTHTLSYEFGDNAIAIGQDAAGLDATEQATALKVMADLIGTLVELQLTKPLPVPKPVPDIVFEGVP